MQDIDFRVFLMTGESARCGHCHGGCRKICKETQCQHHREGERESQVGRDSWLWQGRNGLDKGPEKRPLITRCTTR